MKNKIQQFEQRQVRSFRLIQSILPKKQNLSSCGLQKMQNKALTNCKTTNYLYDITIRIQADLSGFENLIGLYKIIDSSLQRHIQNKKTKNGK